MPYVKTVWVDNTTPVDAAHMNNIEDRLELVGLGEQGIQGITGNDGQTGPIGLTGPQGVDGSVDYNSVSTIKDGDFYTIVTFKRVDNTLYLISTLTNKDVNGFFQTCTLNYYDALGTTITTTVVWTFVNDSTGIVTSKTIT